MPASASAVRDSLIPRLQEAVALGDPEATVARIQDDLTDLINRGAIDLPERLRRVDPDHYARRLLYRDPDAGFTAVVMTWGPGQCTPLHDHAGLWCVEGVIEGTMKVEQYELLEEGEGEGERCRFESRGRVLAGPGSSGALIPPYEYHVLGNATDDTPAVTLHVYSGEMEHCTVFEPEGDGTYRRRSKSLSYTD